MVWGPLTGTPYHISELQHSRVKVREGGEWLRTLCVHEQCSRAVRRYENLGGWGGSHNNVVGIICPPLVEKVSTDLPKTGRALPLQFLRPCAV